MCLLILTIDNIESDVLLDHAIHELVHGLVPLGEDDKLISSVCRVADELHHIVHLQRKKVRSVLVC